MKRLALVCRVVAFGLAALGFYVIMAPASSITTATASQINVTPSNIYRVGLLNAGEPPTSDIPFGAAFVQSMQQRGYTLGQNLAIEGRGARAQLARLPELAQELAARVDVIVVWGYPAVVAAKATGIPVVVAAGGGDPIETDLIVSLAHPGGNVTGISDDATELSTKRLELLKELNPALRRVAMMWNANDRGMSLRYRSAAQAAAAMGIIVQPFGVREPNDLDDAFKAMTKDEPEAMLMIADALVTLNRHRVIDFAAAHRLPAIYEYGFYVRDGGLMSYGVDLAEAYNRAATLVDRILQGAKPADLPFEEPTRYPFLINLRTAKALGLDIPPQLLARADEVIE